MEQILSLLQNEIVVYGLMISIVLVLLIIILQVFRKNRLKRLFRQCEQELMSLRAIPLTFKVNKAIALAKVNDALFQSAINASENADTISEQLAQLTSHLSDTEDEILYGSMTKSAVFLDEAILKLNQLTPLVTDLNRRLDMMLEDEFEQRNEITAIKETFIQCKQFIATHTNELSLSFDALTLTVSEIEVMFESFESWMNASEFEKARLKMSEIHGVVNDLQHRMRSLIELIRECKGKIPTLIEECSSLYSSCRAKNIPVEHLMIPKNLELISSTLKEDLSLLRNAIIENVASNNGERLKRLRQMIEACTHEVTAYEQVYTQLAHMELTLPNIDTKLQTLKQALSALKQRYQTHPKMFDLDQHSLNAEKVKLAFAEIRMAMTSRTPYSTLLSQVKENATAVNALHKVLEDALLQFKTLKEDEERIRKQLLKLHLIVNEIKVKIKKHRLPAISESYTKDLHRSKQMTTLISQLLDKEVIELPRLNQLTTEAIDYIYALYNNVNNIVGMVEMIESAIVFANRYRSHNPVLDSELNRVELSFRNGEYTLALNQALKAIEKYHPHSFEKLIANNAKSAQ